MQVLFPGAFAVKDIAEALHEDLSVAKHIREFPDLSCVFDRLIERYAEVVRRQIATLVFWIFIFETVSVYDGKPAFVIFLRYESAGVLAKRADFIVVRRDVTDKFAFVQHVVDFFHNFVAALHPDADIDDARAAFYAVLSAQIVKPVRADATDCHNHSFRLYDEFLLCNVVDEMRAFAHSAFMIRSPADVSKRMFTPLSIRNFQCGNTLRAPFPCQDGEWDNRRVSVLLRLRDDEFL